MQKYVPVSVNGRIFTLTEVSTQPLYAKRVCDGLIQNLSKGYSIRILGKVLVTFKVPITFIGSEHWSDFYRPQLLLRKCNAFSGVCLSVHRGMSASGSGGVCLRIWGVYTPSRADTSALGRHPQANSPLGRHTPTPTPEMATAVDGMHPTGMHSCFFTVSVNEPFSMTG